ncbi:asparagine synthase (glutamine-hydrolyzing) [Mucilaginibacter sp.]|uniref:asparagine synthase (glutamine-hydrolyzing) n=1 Tax=Mucilaginibacter sp. TaxID=1882438 RepID=UPI0026075384|nr:asparagine synthase (glutamine-hydrolyzing) [Mucilaginibacter sp.]
MCRIAGIISKRLTTDEMFAKTSIMCNALKHGGPDDKGIFLAENTGLAFGHRRLSIIDLSTNGHQPMADINKKTWITFNGEIYNYRELKDQLMKIGAKFHSNTDTEVILQAYLHWGVAAFSKFRGMFAFALYDIEKALTYLVRDAMGIKPLYYHIANEQLSFASEVKALQLARIANENNKTWLIKFLAYGHIPEPDTILNNVFSLPKGSFLCWDHNNCTHHISLYTQSSVTNRITNIKLAEKAINETFRAAINRQLIADAPIGVFLSGGIDSSVVTLLANQQQQHELKTVSLYFNEKEYDESAYQQQIFNKIQGEKFTHLITQHDFEECFPYILSAMDMPTTDGINTWFISNYAHKDGLKAVLSGIGADELFGGYPSFNRIKYIKYLRMIPSSLLKTTNYLVADPLKRVNYLTNNHPFADYLFLRGLFAPAEIAEILNCDEKQVYDALFSIENIPNPGLTNQEKAAWFETNIYMQNQLLHDTDIMSMNNGLEVRVPFLDEDFQNAINSISSEIRFDKNQPKKLLIDTFKDILPQSVWNRPKMGFSFPLQQWMRQHAEINNENLYRNKKAKSIIKDFKTDKVHWSKAFALYQVQLHA